MRVFLAIDFPDTIRGELERLQEQLTVGRLVPSDNLHGLVRRTLLEQGRAVA
ncbi:hypothetical protein [Ruegeria arenilitoris]|uniref:hypothetical protein n=1 Tax=Ruegeria arenilitoris TaxID=1173585 RepID=UPI00147E6BC8|nr:hypothetical protein [Ruegeria arenilitoris]